MVAGLAQVHVTFIDKAGDYGCTGHVVKRVIQSVVGR